MYHAQFVTLPPLEDVHTLFTAATGCACQEEMSWKKWLPLDPDHIFNFMAYIRPCHQKLLMETANQQRDPTAFLRQLLRPFKFNIDFTKGTWTLKKIKELPNTVHKMEGTTVTWSG